MKNIFLAPLLLINLNSLIFPENINYLSDVFDFTIDYSIVLPKEQVNEGFIGNNDKQEPYNETIRYYDKTREIVLKNKSSSGSDYEIIFDKNLKIKRIVSSYDKILKIKNFDTNKITLESFNDGKYLSRKLYLDNKMVSESKINNTDNTILFDAGTLILQACLINDIKGFKADVLFSTLTDKYPCEFKLVTTKNLLEISPEFIDAPDFFKNKSIYANYVNVFVFKLTGAAGVFYKHKYYFAFDNGPSHNFLAYWGGDPKAKDAVFQINN
jgi:hypothetical protein